MLVEPVLFAAAKATNHPAWPPFIDDHRSFGARVMAGDRDGAATQFHAMWGTGEGFHDLPPRMQDYIRDRIHLIVAPWNVILEDAPGLFAPGRLEGLQIPVLLAEGGASPAIIDAVNTALAARLPKVTRLTVPGAGHMLPISHVAQLAPAVQAHLDRA
jgi:pimeloyl-ACP methyl ester carboxylesterase